VVIVLVVVEVLVVDVVAGVVPGAGLCGAGICVHAAARLSARIENFVFIAGSEHIPVATKFTAL
jgi:hypothetical protein